MFSLHTADWIVIVAYGLLTLGLGLAFRRRASSSTQEYFLSGRSLPWWVLGTSMVATTFAADTPLAVTELVATNGIAGNWLWWNLAIGGMLTGTIITIVWKQWLKEPTGLYELIPAFFGSLLVVVVMSLLLPDKRRESVS